MEQNLSGQNLFQENDAVTGMIAFSKKQIGIISESQLYIKVKDQCH